MTSDELSPTPSRETKSVRWWRGRIGRLVLAGGLLLGAVMLWSGPVRIGLSDGRVLVIDKVSTGSTHTAFEPFTLKNLWTVITRWPLAWPHTTYHGEDGTVGVFFRAEPNSRDAADSLYLVDRDGWWWEPTQSGQVGKDRRLAVFPPVKLSSTPRLEVWNDDRVRMGGGTLRLTVPRLPEPDQRDPAPFPIRCQRGETLVIIRGVEVMTRDDVRPSAADVHLKIETFRAGRPVRMKMTDLVITNDRARGSRCTPDAEGRFRTTLSPYSPYWTMHFFVSWESGATGIRYDFVDVVVRPQILGRTSGDGVSSISEMTSAAGEAQMLGRSPADAKSSAADPE